MNRKENKTSNTAWVIGPVVFTKSQGHGVFVFLLTTRTHAVSYFLSFMSGKNYKKKILKFARPLLPHSCTTLREHWLKCCMCLCELMWFIVWNVYCFHCIPVNVAVDFDPFCSEYSCLPGPPLPLAYLHTCHTCSHTQIILLHSIIIYILHTEMFTLCCACTLLYIQPTPWSETEACTIYSRFTHTYTPIILMHAVANLLSTHRHTLYTL